MIRAGDWIGGGDDNAIQISKYRVSLVSEYQAIFHISFDIFQFPFV